MKKLAHTPLVLALLAVSPVSAFSAEAPNLDKDETTLFLGAVTFLSSEHLGSAEQDTSILPYLSVDDFKGFDIFGPAISYRAIETGTGTGLGKWSLRAGPIATYQSGRDSDDSDTLTGLADIDGSLLLGGYARTTIGPVGLRFDAGQDVLGGHEGLVANASIGTFLPLGKLKIQPSATVSWGSGRHNQNFFGITAEQETASGLQQTDVSSGLFSYSLSAVSWYELSDNYVVALIASHSWFTDDITDSPIIQAADGSDRGFFLALGVARKFTL